MWALRAAQFVASALTVLVAINLAILIYARTVTRLGELAVRSALGASRRRILTQLFMEALALALLGAAAGLAIAGYALDVIQTMNETGELMPYWITFALSPRAVMVALALAVTVGAHHRRAARAEGDRRQPHRQPARSARPRWHAAGYHLDGPDRGASRCRRRRAAGGGVHLRARDPR